MAHTNGKACENEQWKRINSITQSVDRLTKNRHIFWFLYLTTNWAAVHTHAIAINRPIAQCYSAQTAYNSADIFNRICDESKLNQTKAKQTKLYATKQTERLQRWMNIIWYITGELTLFIWFSIFPILLCLSGSVSFVCSSSSCALLLSFLISFCICSRNGWAKMNPKHILAHDALWSRLCSDNSQIVSHKNQEEDEEEERETKRNEKNEKKRWWLMKTLPLYLERKMDEKSGQDKRKPHKCLLLLYICVCVLWIMVAHK